MFSKREYSPYEVSDRATFRNVDKTLTLYVRSDAASLVSGIQRVYEKLDRVNEDSGTEAQMEAARQYATAVFGEEQAEKLIALYHGEALPVIIVMGQYFQRRLARIITRAQKKSRKRK